MHILKSEFHNAYTFHSQWKAIKQMWTSLKHLCWLPAFYILLHKENCLPSVPSFSWMVIKCLHIRIHTHWILLGILSSEVTAGDEPWSSKTRFGTPLFLMESVLLDLDCCPSSLVFWLQVSQGFNKSALSSDSKHKRSDLARDSSPPWPTRGSPFSQLSREVEHMLKSSWKSLAKLQRLSTQFLRRFLSVWHPMQEEEKVN